MQELQPTIQGLWEIRQHTFQYISNVILSIIEKHETSSPNYIQEIVSKDIQHLESCFRINKNVNDQFKAVCSFLQSLIYLQSDLRLSANSEYCIKFDRELEACSFKEGTPRIGLLKVLNAFQIAVLNMEFFDHNNKIANLNDKIESLIGLIAELNLLIDEKKQLVELLVIVYFSAFLNIEFSKDNKTPKNKRFIEYFVNRSFFNNRDWLKDVMEEVCNELVVGSVAAEQGAKTKQVDSEQKITSATKQNNTDTIQEDRAPSLFEVEKWFKNSSNIRAVYNRFYKLKSNSIIQEINTLIRPKGEIVANTVEFSKDSDKIFEFIQQNFTLKDLELWLVGKKSLIASLLLKVQINDQFAQKIPYGDEKQRAEILLFKEEFYSFYEKLLTHYKISEEQLIALFLKNNPKKAEYL